MFGLLRKLFGRRKPHNCCQPDKVDAGHELEVARRALEEEADPKHALHQICAALSVDPLNPLARRLLARVAEAIDVCKTLPPLSGDIFVSDIIARAIVEFERDNITGAVSLLRMVHHSAP